MNSLPKLRQEATLLMDSGQIHNIKTFDIAHKYKREINLAENKKNAWVQSLLNPLKLEEKEKKEIFPDTSNFHNVVFSFSLSLT